jgi:hypothetical protein
MMTYRLRSQKPTTVVAGKIGSRVFSFQKSILTRGLPKKIRKHFSNPVKPNHSLQKHKKPAQNLK